MLASYAVTAHPDRNLLSFTLSGFFDPAGLPEFDDVRRAAIRQLNCAPSDHVTLVDLRDLKIQSQAVFDRFSAMIDDPTTRARRLALVTGNGAIRIQARRLCGRDGVRCFADLAAAEQWLAASPTDFALAG